MYRFVMKELAATPTSVLPQIENKYLYLTQDDLVMNRYRYNFLFQFYLVPLGPSLASFLYFGQMLLSFYLAGIRFLRGILLLENQIR